MATNSLVKAHSLIPRSSICDTAKDSISASLEPKHPLNSAIEAASSANTAAASSGSNIHVAHAGHVAPQVGCHASRAALATHAADIKTITDNTIRLLGVHEEASHLNPTMSANDPAALFTTGTSHHSALAALGPARVRVSDNHAPTVRMVILAVLFGLVIIGFLIGFLVRWLRKRQLLSRLHASHQDETARAERNADVPSSAGSLSSGVTITPARVEGR